MFGKKQINLDMIVPTSKIALKTSCFRACEGDIDKAERLYEFFAKDLANLPDFDVPPPTPFSQAKEMIGDAFSWLDSNQEKIAGYYQLFQQLRNGGGVPVELPNVPPIPNE